MLKYHEECQNNVIIGTKGEFSIWVCTLQKLFPLRNFSVYHNGFLPNDSDWTHDIRDYQVYQTNII